MLACTNIHPSIPFLKTTSKEYQWMKLDKNVLNFQEDLFLSQVYVPLDQSSFAFNMQHILVYILESHIVMHKNKGDVIASGDLNAGKWV